MNQAIGIFKKQILFNSSVNIQLDVLGKIEIQSLNIDHH